MASSFVFSSSRPKVQNAQIDVQALYREGQELMNQEKWFTAEARFRQVMVTTASHGLARAHRAICLFNMGREKEALREAERAVVDASRESYAHFALGVVRHASGRLKQAERSISRALRIDPSNHCYRNRLGEVQTELMLVRQV